MTLMKQIYTDQLCYKIIKSVEIRLIRVISVLFPKGHMKPDSQTPQTIRLFDLPYQFAALQYRCQPANLPTR